jgi:hypothetical protein
MLRKLDLAGLERLGRALLQEAVAPFGLRDRGKPQWNRFGKVAGDGEKCGVFPFLEFELDLEKAHGPVFRRSLCLIQRDLDDRSVALDLESLSFRFYYEDRPNFVPRRFIGYEGRERGAICRSKVYLAIDGTFPFATVEGETAGLAFRLDGLDMAPILATNPEGQACPAQGVISRIVVGGVKRSALIRKASRVRKDCMTKKSVGIAGGKFQLQLDFA